MSTNHNELNQRGRKVCYVKKEMGDVVGALIDKRYMGDVVPYYNH